ncbi:lipid II-degrading bacteriocin, partial [Pseudomonas aeruginosa]|nr:lipid II-degrading bacteriocin [Pseudomonas aeruginosa]
DCTSGQWSFRGEIRAYDDLYDFNPSNHRTETAEGMTRLGREVGQKFKDTTPYPIGIPGAIPVNISG